MAQHTFNGYQNVESAQKVANFVIDNLTKNYENIDNKSFLIIAADNSSSYLSAFIKILKPNWFVISGNKHKKDYIKTGPGDIWNYSINNKVTSNLNIIGFLFVDDWLAKGITLNCAMKVAKKVTEFLEIAPDSYGKIPFLSYFGSIGLNMEVTGKEFLENFENYFNLSINKIDISQDEEDECQNPTFAEQEL